MKKTFYLSLILVVLSAFMSAQTDKTASISNSTQGIEQEPSPAKTQYIKEQSYLSPNSLAGYKNLYGDSLKGFNETKIKNELLAKGIEGWEIALYLQHVKRNFINEKYALVKPPVYLDAPQQNTLPSGKKGTTAIINATPCVNEDFELTPSGVYNTGNAVQGWTISNRASSGQGGTCGNTGWMAGSPEFSVLTTPLIWPTIGTIPHSPLGGTQIARLNNSNTGTCHTRIQQSFPVTNNNTLFQFAYAGFWQDGGHGCCDQPGLAFKMYDCNGNQLACSSLSLFPGNGCNNGATYTVSNNASWTNWQVRFIDLTPYIGGCVTVEITTTDCAFSGHYGTSFFDAKCGGQALANVPGLSGTGSNIAGPVSFCAGSGIAQISAPLGYAAYQWVSPLTGTIPAPQGTMATLSVQNPVPGTVYTVNLTSPSGCQYVATNTIVFTQVNIAGIGSSSTCANGASGSATVVGNGSGSGYNYLWTNSSNSVVGTGSVAFGLPVGIYTVVLTGQGNAGCGSATGTVQVHVAPPGVTPLFKPFCGTQAFLITAGGSNFRWYNGMSPIPNNQGGNASSYTVNPAQNGAIYRLSYLSNQGCQDSIEFTLNASTPGNLIVPASNISWVCPGGSNGTATIMLTPAAGAPPGINAFTVTNANASTPVYNSSVFPTIYNSYAVSGLSAGTYTVNAFDGSCKYGTTFNVSAYNFNYNVTPATTIVCQGGTTPANIVFPSPPNLGQYSYTWSPSTFLLSNTQNNQNTFITPTAVAGAAPATQIYTVTVTPTVVNCPVTRTMALTYVNPATPTIFPIPNMCDNGAAYTISVSPTGGTFSTPVTGTANPIGVNSGIITPNAAGINLGPNTFTYATTVIGCAATQTANYGVSHFNPSTLTSSVPALCNNAAPFNLMNIVQSSANGTWTGVSGVTGSGSAYSFNPSNLATGIYAITYSTTSSPNPTVCPSATTISVPVTSKDLPVFGNVQPFCTNASSFALAASPSGGTWGGNPGVSVGGVVTPNNLNLNNTTVAYSVTVGPCVNSNTMTLQFSQFNPANFSGSIPELCATSSNPFNLMSIVQNTNNGVWKDQSGNPIPNTFNPSTMLTGTYNLTYHRSSTPNPTLCADTRTINVSVLKPAIPSIAQSGPFCSKDANIQLNVDQTSGHWTSSSYLSATGVLSPSLCAIGNNPVQYVVGTNTCFIQATKFISVEAFVPATISTPVPDQCNTGSPTNLLPFTASGNGVWSGSGITGTNFNPGVVGSGRFELTYKTASSPSGLCPDQSTIAVNVYSLAPPVLQEPMRLCTKSQPIHLTVSPVGGLFGGTNSNIVSNKGLVNPGLGVIGENIINYSVTVGPCIAYAQTTVTIEKFVSAELSSMPRKEVYCQGADEGFDLMTLVQNPVGSWSGTGITPGTNFFDPMLAQPGTANVFTYTIKSTTDNEHCGDVSTTTIKVGAIPKISVSLNSASVGCAPLQVVLTPEGNQGVGKGTWIMGDDSEPINDLNVEYVYKKPGTYTATLQYVSSEGCPAKPFSVSPSFTVLAPPVANFSFPDEILISNPEIQLTNLSTTLSDNRYQWKLPTGTTISEVNPSVKFEKAGKYPVTLIAESVGGNCKNEITKIIEVKNDFNIYIPSSFSPNADNLNDVFMPVFSEFGLDTKTFEMEIFDRWGHSLYRTKDVTKGWDGTINNKGEVVKEEVYVYKLKYKDVDGNLYSKIGHISLIK